MHGPASTLRGWTRHLMADGAIFVPADPSDRGLLRVREQVPLLPFREIVARLLSDGRAVFEARAIGRLEHFRTSDGEHAALVSVDLSDKDGARAQRTIACVASDSSLTIFDAVATEEARFAEYNAHVRLVATSWYVGLSQLRRRRYEHRPPREWPAIGRPHVVEYLHPEYPNVPTVIAVMDAIPCSAIDSQDAYCALMIESLDVEPAGHEPLELAAGLSGQVSFHTTTADGQRRLNAHAILVDALFQYRAHLECSPNSFDASLETFRGIVESFKPIPRPDAHMRAASGGHWVD